MHKCKCKYCNEVFDRDSVPFVKVDARRYAHENCYNEHMATRDEEQAAQDEFFEYIKTLFGKDYNYMVINKQIQHYIKEYGYSYNGILKSLKWFYDIEKHKPDKSNGNIAIVPFIYDQAKEYYYKLWLTKEANDRQDFNDFEPKAVEITIESPSVYRKPHRLFFMEEDNG